MSISFYVLRSFCLSKIALLGVLLFSCLVYSQQYTRGFSLSSSHNTSVKSYCGSGWNGPCDGATGSNGRVGFGGSTVDDKSCESGRAYRFGIGNFKDADKFECIPVGCKVGFQTVNGTSNADANNSCSSNSSSCMVSASIRTGQTCEGYNGERCPTVDFSLSGSIYVTLICDMPDTIPKSCSSTPYGADSLFTHAQTECEAQGGAYSGNVVSKDGFYCEEGKCNFNSICPFEETAPPALILSSSYSTVAKSYCGSGWNGPCDGSVGSNGRVGFGGSTVDDKSCQSGKAYMFRISAFDNVDKFECIPVGCKVGTPSVNGSSNVESCSSNSSSCTVSTSIRTGETCEGYNGDRCPIVNISLSGSIYVPLICDNPPPTLPQSCSYTSSGADSLFAQAQTECEANGGTYSGSVVQRDCFYCNEGNCNPKFSGECPDDNPNMLPRMSFKSSSVDMNVERERFMERQLKSGNYYNVKGQSMGYLRNGLPKTRMPIYSKEILKGTVFAELLSDDNNDNTSLPDFFLARAATDVPCGNLGVDYGIITDKGYRAGITCPMAEVKSLYRYSSLETNEEKCGTGKMYRFDKQAINVFMLNAKPPKINVVELDYMFSDSTILTQAQRDSIYKHEEGHKIDMECIAKNFPVKKAMIDGCFCDGELNSILEQEVKDSKIMYDNMLKKADSIYHKTHGHSGYPKPEENYGCPN